MRPRGTATGIFLAAAVASGCLTSHFQPTVPMRARTGDLELTLSAVEVGFADQFVFRSRSAAPHAIRQAWLTEGTRALCTGGEEAEGLTVDGRPLADGPLGAGEHLIAARFPAAPAWTMDLVVDLVLDDGGCARAPALSQSLPLVAPRRTVVLISNALDGTSLSGLSALYGGRIGAGRWLGPVLLTGELGVAMAMCAPAVCGKDSDGSLRSRATFPVALDARFAITSWIRGQTPNVLLAGARYSYQRIHLPGLDGQRHFDAHGVHAVLGWGFGQLHGAGPFQHLERTPLAEAIIPLGVMIESGGREQKVAFSGGFGLRVLLPL